MEADVVILASVGARLRGERERLRLNQEDFGSLAGVTRNSQQTYEAGKRPFPISYLLALKAHRVDIVFVLTGQRSAGMLSDDEASILAAVDVMSPYDRSTLLRLASSLAGQPAPMSDIKLPSTAALEDALAGFLEGSPGLKEDELARELATSLPTILRAAADEIDSPRSDRGDAAPAPPAAAGADRREAQQGQRI